MDERLERARDLAETDPDEALRLCSQVLNDYPNNGTATYIAARIMLLAERFGLAHIMFRRCNELNPGKSELLNSLGLSLEISDPAKALDYYEQALLLDPENYHALNNKAIMVLRQGKPEECIDLCNQALALEPEHTAAIDNRSMGYLTLRRWREGWKDYQGSLGLSRTRREYGVPVWDGVSRGTIVVYGEQGLGDEILFSACIPDLLKTNEVVIDCDRRLADLFKRSFPCPVYGTRYNDQTPLLDEHEIDFQLAMGDLPRYFRNTDDSFGGDAYLIPDPDRCIQWRALFDQLPHCSSNQTMKKRQKKGKTIGLAWQGGVDNTQKGQRSFDLDTFAPLFDLPHTFISLEYNEPDLKGYPIKHYGRAVNKGVDYDETMALIHELDLVICVTTTAVHAAGAMGVECWCLTPKYPSYRFHLDGGIPWHNSVQLVRQVDTWDNVILQVKDMLESKWQTLKAV